MTPRILRVNRLGPAYRLIQTLDAVDILQIESRAQVSALSRSQPDCFEDPFSSSYHSPRGTTTGPIVTI